MKVEGRKIIMAALYHTAFLRSKIYKCFKMKKVKRQRTRKFLSSFILLPSSQKELIILQQVGKFYGVVFHFEYHAFYQ